MLSSIFDFNELKNKDDENRSFAELLIQDLNTVILAADEIEVKKWLRQQNIRPDFVIVENFDMIEAFLCRNKGNSDDWFLIVSDKKFDCSKYGTNFVQCRYRFGGVPQKFQTQSFTEHAKNKILYNELSWLYMDSIANDTPREVDFLEKIFTENHAKKILDCCCGVGRHAVRLGELGFKVTGIDASKAQINTAQQHNKNVNVEYFVHDAENFLLSDKNYDAAICMWTTYNYFSKETDLKAVLKCLSAHLREGGLLILDSKNIPILDKERLYHRTRKKNNLDMTLLVYKRVVDSIQMSRYFYFLDVNGTKNFYLDEEFVRFYSLAELRELSGFAFEPVCAYGDFDGNLFKETDSERMITVWKKNCRPVKNDDFDAFKDVIN